MGKHCPRSTGSTAEHSFEAFGGVTKLNAFLKRATFVTGIFIGLVTDHEKFRKKILWSSESEVLVFSAKHPAHVSDNMTQSSSLRTAESVF